MNQRGFTLIELVVVIGILGILAAIAIPTYSNYRISAYRASAKTELLNGAQNMERLMTRTSSYATATVGVGANNQVQQWTTGKKYQLSLPDSDLTATTYTIRATPQFTDSKCGYLEVKQTGAKTSEISGNCW